jgi:hypothetical protein
VGWGGVRSWDTGGGAAELPFYPFSREPQARLDTCSGNVTFLLLGTIVAATGLTWLLPTHLGHMGGREKEF